MFAFSELQDFTAQERNLKCYAAILLYCLYRSEHLLNSFLFTLLTNRIFKGNGKGLSTKDYRGMYTL